MNPDRLTKAARVALCALVLSLAPAATFGQATDTGGTTGTTADGTTGGSAGGTGGSTGGGMTGGTSGGGTETADHDEGGFDLGWLGLLGLAGLLGLKRRNDHDHRTGTTHTGTRA